MLGLEVSMLAQEYQQDEECVPTGVPLVDDLSYGQRLGLLRVAAEALLCEEVPAPKRSAYLDAIVASVYDNLRGRVQAELMDEESGQQRREREARGEPAEPDPWGPDDPTDPLPSIRERIAGVCEQVGDLAVPDPGCVTYEVWEERIESLLDRVLLDRDFEYGAVFLDTAPRQGGTLKELMGVPRDYYTAVPDDLSREEIERAIARLRELAHSG